MKFDPQGMLELIPKAMLGWAGVFVVIIVLIGITAVLNKVTNRK